MEKPSVEDAFKRLQPETALERQIISSEEWIEGTKYGKPRRGHPEGEVIHHIHEVLGNVERLYGKSPLRAKLRLIALIHDTFKYKVDQKLPKTGENYHAMIARRFAEQWISDEDVLLVIQLHDDAYDAWLQGARHRDWAAARCYAAELRGLIGPYIDLYMAFYECDIATGDKVLAPLRWFKKILRE